MRNVVDRLDDQQAADANSARARRRDDEDAVAPGHVDKARVGAFAHALIAGLLAGGQRDPSPERIASASARLPGLADVGSYRVAVRQRTTTSAALYFRLFVPGDEWTFEGAELRGLSARFDLVWRSPAGVVVDELKSGRGATRRALAELREQTARETRAGASMFGEQFLGVRAVILGAPRTSFFADRDGGCATLEWRS